MRCEKNYDIVSYLKEELEAEQREEIRLHIESCSSCRKELDRINALLRVVGRMKHVDSAPEFHERVRMVFAREHPDFLRRVGGRRGRAGGERLGWWRRIVLDIKEQFRYVPAWAISGCFHVVAIAVIALILSNVLTTDVKKREQGRGGVASVMPTPDTSGRALTPAWVRRNEDETALLLKSSDPEVRRSAVIILGEAGTESALRHIRQMLDDPDDRVSSAAKGVLDRLGTK